jgi:YgiT-type zinc finger domain-containing protein
MHCVLCRQGKTRPGNVTVTLERGGTVVIFKGVPADVCENCGEYDLTGAVTDRLLSLAEEAVRHGAEVEILRYAA